MYPIIDSHCHIYPDKIAAKAVHGIGKFYDLNMGGEGTASDMLKLGREAGISKFIVFSVATTPYQTDSINNFIASEVQKYPEYMSGLGTIHPDSGDLSGDVSKIIELGLKGVKIHPDFQGFKIDDYRYLKVYEKCEENNLPVLIHTGDKRYDYSNPNRMKVVLDIFKGLKVIGAHFGGWSMWDEASKELCGYDNFYVDCSSSLYALSPEKATEIIRRYGAERVLFGTDYPMWPAKEEIKRFSLLQLTPEEKKAILSENAVKIFQLD